MGVKGPKPMVFFGTILKRFRNPVSLLDQSYVRKYGNVFGIFNGTDPVLFVADPALVKQVLVKDFQRFSDRRTLKTEHPLINKNLFNTEGETWKRLRTIMSGTFTSGKMRKMYPLVRQCIQEYLEHMEILAKRGEPIDAKALHQGFTMDVIARTAFGTETNSQKEPNSPFVRNAHDVFKFNPWKVIPAFIFPKWLNTALGIRTHLGESPNNWIFELSRHLLQKRRNGFKNNDFLQLLVEANAADINANHQKAAIDNESHHVNEGEDEKMAENSALSLDIADKMLTDDEIIAQSWLILTAGFETTATTLGYISYLMALYPSSQERIRAEVAEAVDADGEINYETLQRLPYLDACLTETLRLYPPVARLERVASEDIALGVDGVVVRKRQRVEIPVYAIHRSEKYYSQPNEFRPDRWLPENKHKLVPY
ncbi:unnamed protein product, partial [Medioppia subpectinata]